MAEGKRRYTNTIRLVRIVSEYSRGPASGYSGGRRARYSAVRQAEAQWTRQNVMVVNHVLDLKRHAVVNSIHRPAIDGWHDGCGSRSNRVVHSVEGGEEEQLILLNRPAHGTAKLLETIFLFWRAAQVWVVRVQAVIAEEAVPSAMEIIGPRFQTDIDHGALKPPKFRGGIGHYVDFLDGILRQDRQFVGASGRADERSGVDEDVAVLHSIKQIVIALAAGTVGFVVRRIPARVSVDSRLEVQQFCK